MKKAIIILAAAALAGCILHPEEKKREGRTYHVRCYWAEKPDGELYQTCPVQGVPADCHFEPGMTVDSLLVCPDPRPPQF